MPNIPDTVGQLDEPFEQQFTRQEASEYGLKKYKVFTSVRSFETLPIEYKVVRGRALYGQSALDRYLRGLLANAARRIGKPLKR